MFKESLLEFIRAGIAPSHSILRLPLYILFSWILVIMSCIIFELLLGFSVYTLLIDSYGYSEANSAFITSLVFLSQAVLLLVCIRSYLRSVIRSTLFAKEFERVKTVISSFADGLLGK